MVVSCFYSLQDGRAAIHFAAQSAREDLLKLLLAKKADATQEGGVRYFSLQKILYLMSFGFVLAWLV